MQPKTTIIVPVYNPGKHIDDCITSVLDQTLPAAEYEVIFADDGSTDGTAERLEDLAARHDHVRVIHMTHSGTPGAARNAGIEAARGSHVYFVDDDDWISRDAMQRLYKFAERHAADVVIGREVGHNGKDVSKELFRKNRPRTSLASRPSILVLLTPHKLFRTAFLNGHGIRFPENKRRLEDHEFCLQAYFQTDRVAILADHACYHWRARGDQSNVSAVASDPAQYYRWLRDVLDLVHRNTDPGPYRDRLLAHWYRSKGLKQLGLKKLLDQPKDFYQKSFGEVRTLALEHFPPSVDAHLSASMRVRSALLRAGHADALEAVARSERGITLPVLLEQQRWEEDVLVLILSGTLSYADGRPVRFTEEDGRMYWVLPLAAREQRQISPDMREVTESLAKSRLNVLIRSRKTRIDFFVPTSTELHYRVANGATVLSVAAEVRLDPASAAGGHRRLSREAPWELIGRFTSCGWTSHRSITQDLANDTVELTAGRSGNVVVAPYWHADGVATLAVATGSRTAPESIARSPELLRVQPGDGEVTFRLPLLCGPKGKRLAEAIVVQHGWHRAPLECPVSITSDSTPELQGRFPYGEHHRSAGLYPGTWSVSARFGSRVVALGVDLQIRRSGEVMLRTVGPVHGALHRGVQRLPRLPEWVARIRLRVSRRLRTRTAGSHDSEDKAAGTPKGAR